jgi:hypothetical protein
MQTLTKVESRTESKLTEMFTANTGRHLLDSGGAYGRNWERNQGLTVQDFSGQPKATWERGGYITVNAWHYLNDRLEYSKAAEVLTRLMHVWELADFDNRNLYNLGDQEDFLKHLGAEPGNVWNTYNWDNLLSQTLQGYDFELAGSRYVMLQVHGGCDVRGGYTLPVIFELGQWIDYFLLDTDSAELYCDGCNISGNYRGPDLEWYRHGELPPTPFGEAERCFYAPSGYDMANGCPECGGDLEANSLEVY